MLCYAIFWGVQQFICVDRLERVVHICGLLLQSTLLLVLSPKFLISHTAMLISQPVYIINHRLFKSSHMTTLRRHDKFYQKLYKKTQKIQLSKNWCTKLSQGNVAYLWLYKRQIILKQDFLAEMNWSISRPDKRFSDKIANHEKNE